MNTIDPGDYYLKRRKKYDRDFRELRKIVRPFLAARRGKEFAVKIDLETATEYERLLAKVPFIGGDANRLTWNLVSAAIPLAFYNSMKAHGVPVAEIGELVYRAMDAWYGMIPRLVLKLVGIMKTSRGELKKIRLAAAGSRARSYAADWVYDFVEGGRGNDFDFGVDYRECAIVKFLKAEDAAEFAPYLCLFDFVASERMGLGLTRTSTIAAGASVCDFRFKRGGKTEPGWPPR